MNKKDLKNYDHCRSCGVVMRKSALHILVRPHIGYPGFYVSERMVCDKCISKFKGEWKHCPICQEGYFEEQKEK